jgi:uncharacterized protein (TIGR00725 family)
MSKNNSNRKFISVIGGYPCSSEEARMAELVGYELARRGAVLICGGEGGVMEAACKGAQTAGGITVGILPGDARQHANPFVTVPIVTGIGAARNVIVVKSGQAVIAIGGGYGTLSEISFAIKSRIPVIGLNTWSFSRENAADSSIILAEDPAGAVDLALELADLSTV